MVKSVYPILEDPIFAEKITQIEDFKIFNIPKSRVYKNKEEYEERVQQMCQFEKTYYQHFVSQYISRRSPYKSLLLYHGLGSGKTCSAITIAEAFSQEQRLYSEPNIWIISRKALKGSFEQEIFRTLYLITKPQKRDIRDQCTGDAYLQLIPNVTEMEQDKLLQRLQKTIRSKYQFFGYDQFANTIDKLKEEGKLEEIIKNKIIIIDEAHNLRNVEKAGDKHKKIVEPLMDVLQKGTNNRLILLSATPMYNEAEEMLWLLSLLLTNDRRDKILSPYNLPSFYSASGKPNKELFKLCGKLSQNYISYIKGNNPFTFAIRLPAPEEEVTFLKEVPQIALSGKPLEKNEANWLSWIRDGLVTSTLGKTQIDAIETKTTKKHSSATLRQMNIFAYRKLLGKDNYEYRDGKEALNSIFKRADDLESIQYVYQNPKEPIFDPEYGALGDFACKLKTLSDLIRNSEGIVLIYSMFIWGGIVPTAMVLEHMGLSRYKERDFLKMNRKVTNQVNYEGILKPTYCILSSESDKELMGTSKIDDLLKDINLDANRNGEIIKVILISPVAGEGLSFKNIREMHVLDPWYHLNNQEQAIGRAIRNCSHSDLPLEKRNVTVFLHATVFPNNLKETSDLHAYRLASLKYQQIQAVDQVIKENAVDCMLMKNVNYYGKELFDFKVMLYTSRGRQIPYQYGDLLKDDIKCVNTDYKVHDTRSFREESYEGFIPTLQQKLRKYLEKEYRTNSKKAYSYEEIVEIIHPNIEISTKVLEASLMPYRLWENKVLIYHYNSFIISEMDKKIPITSRIQLLQDLKKDEEVVVECSLHTIFEQLDKDTMDVAILKVYQALDSKCWKQFAEEIIQTQTSKISVKLQKALSILELNGAFIMKTEVTSSSPSIYSGYVNLFSDEEKFEIVIWDSDEYREATDSEMARIQKMRKATPFTNPTKVRITDTIGFVQRYKGKEPNAPYRFQFKLGFNNEKGKRSGVVCETLKKPQIQEELKKFNIENKANVSQLCFALMLELIKSKRFWLPAIYKPK